MFFCFPQKRLLVITFSSVNMEEEGRPIYRRFSLSTATMASKLYSFSIAEGVIDDVSDVTIIVFLNRLVIIISIITDIDILTTFISAVNA